MEGAGDIPSSLLAWIQSLADVPKTVHSLADLVDGVVLTEVLAHISPLHVDTSLLKRDAADNWLLRESNLKTLVSYLEQFFEDTLGHRIELDINATAIAKDCDTQEIVKLVEFVLGAAIQCDSKETYIHGIMTLDQASQASLMMVIEQQLNPQHVARKKRSSLRSPHSFKAPTTPEPRGRPSSALDAEELYEKVQQLETINHELSDLFDKSRMENRQLQQGNAQLMDEKAELNGKVQKMEDRLRRAEESGAKMQADLRRSASQLQVAGSETVKVNALKTLAEEREATIAEQQKKIDELAKVAEENRRLRDDLHIAKEETTELQEARTQIKKLKKKQEDALELRNKLKVMEEERDKLLENKLDMEEEIQSTIPQLKKQIEAYKCQVVDLEAKVNEVALELQRKGHEASKAKEDLELALTESQHLRSQVGSLTAKLEEARDSAALELNGQSMGMPLSDMTPDTREKIMRLERENKRLKEQCTGDGEEKVALLVSQLDDLRRIKEKCEQDNRALDLKLVMAEDELTAMRTTPSRVQRPNLDGLEERIMFLRRAVGAVTQNASPTTTQTLEEAMNALIQEKNKALEEATERSSLVPVMKRKEDVMNELTSLDVEGLKRQNYRLLEEREALRGAEKEHLEELTSVLREKDRLNKMYVETKEQLLSQQESAKEVHAELGRREKKIHQLQEEVGNALVEAKRGASVEDGDMRVIIGDLQRKLETRSSTIGDLEKEKQRLETLLRQQKEKGRASFPGSPQVVHSEAVQSLQNQLREKDREIEFLKKMREENKEAAKREERLIVSAFYDVGLELQRLRTPLMAHTPNPTSWLGQRRMKL